MLAFILTSLAFAAAKSPESSLVGVPLWEVKSRESIPCVLPMEPAALAARLGVVHPTWDRAAGIDTIGTMDVHFGGGQQIGRYDREAYRHKMVNPNRMPAGVQVALRRTENGFEVDRWADDGTAMDPIRGIDRIELLPWEESPEHKQGYAWWRLYATHAAMLVEHGSQVTIVDTALWFSESTQWRTAEHWVEEAHTPYCPITMVDTFDVAALFPRGFSTTKHSLTAVEKKMRTGMRWFLPTVLIHSSTGQTTWLAFYALDFWRPPFAIGDLNQFQTAAHVCSVTSP